MTGVEPAPWWIYRGDGLPRRRAGRLPCSRTRRVGAFDGGPPLPVPTATDTEFVRRLGVFSEVHGRKRHQRKS